MLPRQGLLPYPGSVCHAVSMAPTAKKKTKPARVAEPYALVSCGGRWVAISAKPQTRGRTTTDAVLWLRTPAPDELDDILLTLASPDIRQLVLKPDGVPVPLGVAAPDLIPHPAPLNVGHHQAVRAVEHLKKETGLDEAEVFEGLMIIAEEGSRRGGGFVRLAKTIQQARRRARLDTVP